MREGTIQSAAIVPFPLIARPWVQAQGFQPRRGDRYRRLVATLDRDEIEHAIEALIGFLDCKAPNPDIEANGDELDGTGGEDDFCAHSLYAAGPGCPLADIAEDDDSDRCAAGDDMVRSGAAIRYCDKRVYSPGMGDDDDAEGDDAGFPEYALDQTTAQLNAWGRR